MFFLLSYGVFLSSKCLYIFYGCGIELIHYFDCIANDFNDFPLFLKVFFSSTFLFSLSTSNLVSLLIGVITFRLLQTIFY